MKNFCFVIIISILIFHTSCNYYSLEILCGRSSITETEAKEDTKKKLKTYCEKEGIDIKEFSEPEISKQKDVPWIIDYTSKKDDAEPYHFF
jgi:REP element-mobilizing transposase RayT